MTTGEYTAGAYNLIDDFITELLDEDPRSFCATTTLKESTCPHLLNDDPLPIALSSVILAKPTDAFRVVQVWEKAFISAKMRFSRDFRQNFFNQLLVLLVSPPSEFPFATSKELRALDYFLAVLSRLLRQWREADQEFQCWRRLNPSDMRAIELAEDHVTVSYSARAADPRKATSFTWESSDATTSRTVQAGRTQPVLRVIKQIAKQKNTRHAAETVAYLLFYEFLLSRILLGFCKRCDEVFVLGKKRKYCCKSCASLQSSYTTKYASHRDLYLKRLSVADTTLRAWCAAPVGNWRKVLEAALYKAAGNVGGRQDKGSQVVSRWINASRSPEDSLPGMMKSWARDDVPKSQYQEARRKFLNVFSLIRKAEELQPPVSRCSR
jgi:hypothetical protein